MEIIEQIGAYAGLASIVGLAILSALYFSQARDVKRLREWAGRAPERAEEPASGQQPVPGRVVAQPQQKPKGKPTKLQADELEKIETSGGATFVIDGEEGLVALETWLDAV